MQGWNRSVWAEGHSGLGGLWWSKVGHTRVGWGRH